MEGATLAKMLGIFLLSSVKLLFAPGAGIAAGLSLHQTALMTSTGGCCGVLFFYHSGHWFMEQINHLISSKGRTYGLKPRIRKKSFTRRNRMLIRLKYQFGMLGIAVLTPAVISIPIGSVVAARFYWDNKWMLPFLLISTILWSLFLTYLALGVKQELFGW